ncbi:MAG: c-type cytochrome [Saprospiraceae bacterium]|nr:c-type cytochrome [Saprospiraceae bacterium]
MIKKIISIFTSVLMTVLLMTSCQHDPILVIDPQHDENSGDTTQVGNVCNPDSIYFAKDVLPILATNCALSGCHDAQTHKEGIALIDYSRTVSTGKVKPYKPSDSKLYKSLFESGEDRMPPPPNASLSVEQKNIIKKWIEQGAQNLSCNPDAGGCNVINVTFSGFVQPLINARCQGCHSSTSLGGGILLNTYAQIKSTAMDGSLYGSVSHASGYSAMPKVGNTLSPCELAKIKTWIDAGAQQN